MTLARKLIIAFWVLIIIMLGWQVYSCNASMTQQAVEHPQQTQFFFYQSNGASAVQPKPVYHGASLQQVGFVVQPDTPTPGSFTCLVTLKNIGTAKATNIQVCVRPYRGIPNNDEDVSRNVVKPIDDNNPLAQVSQWVSFPDIAPGESSTQSCSFVSKSGVKPGHNPNPEISFESEKKPQDIKPRQPAPTQ